MVRKDPLFAAEGLDIEGAARAIDALESALSDLESVLSKISWRHRLFLLRYPLAQYAVPLPFLRAFVECEELRRSYLSAPTEENAQKLLKGWRDAAQAFMHSIKRFSLLHKLLYTIEKQGSSFEFNDLMGNKTTLADVNRTLAMMRKNAEQLERTVQEREQMFKDGSVFFEHTAIVPAPLPEFQAGEMSPLNAHLHALEQKCIPVLQQGVLETHGPLWYELPHFDGPPTKHLFTIDIARDSESGLRSARVFLVDRFYFLPIAGPNVRFGGIGRAPFELLIKRGIRYWRQAPTMFYCVRDHRYWADLLTIIDRIRRPHLDRRLIEAQRSSLFDLLLGTGVRAVHLYIGTTLERIQFGEFKEYSLLFGLLMMSQPSIYYLPFNRSVWRLEEQPNFLGSARVNQKDQLDVTEETVIADTTPEEMEVIMQGVRIRDEERGKEGLIPPITTTSTIP